MTWLALIIGWVCMDPIIVTGRDAQCIERGYVWAAGTYKPYCISPL